MAARFSGWAALCVGIALSLGGPLAALTAPPIRYQATAQVVLILPTTARTSVPASNPFLYIPDGMVTLARTAVVSARSDAFMQDLLRDGFTSKFEVDAEISTAVVRFSVEGAGQSDVDEDMALVLSKFSELIDDTQREVGAPNRQVASVLKFDSARARAVSGDRTRAAVAAALVGMSMTVVAVRWITRIRQQGRPYEPLSSGSVPRQLGRKPSLTRRGSREPRRPRQPSLPDRSAWEGWQFPAVAFVIAYAGLLLVIPSRLGIAAIGGPGKPASLWALLAIGLWAAMAAGGLTPHKARPMRIAVALLGLAVAASYIAGNLVGWYQPADIHQRSNSRWRLVTLPELSDVMVTAGDRGLLAMAGWLGIVLVTAEGMRSWRDLELLVTWVVRFAAVVAALGVVQYYTNLNVAAMIQIPGLSAAVDFTTFNRSVLNRVVSTAGHPIELGVNMAALFPLALHRSLYMRKPLAWIPTILLGLMVFMSVSRSAVVVVGCALVILFLGWSNRWRLTAIVALPILAVAGRAAFPGLLGTIRGLFQNLESDPSVEGRTQDYPFFLDAFAENPLFGRGNYTWGSYYFRALDNQVLVSLLEIGLLGVLASVCLILTATIGGLLCRRFTSDPRNRHLGQALAASVAGITLSYFTFDTLAFNQAAGLTSLLIGMSGAAYRLAREGADGGLDRSSMVGGTRPVPQPSPSPCTTDA